MEESNEEWNKAKEVNARLIELGETPVVALDEYPVITDIKEIGYENYLVEMIG